MSKKQERSASNIYFPYRLKKLESVALVEPLIKIHVRAKYGWQPLWFLVDTGADTSTMTLKLAKDLGLEYDKKDRTELQGVGSKPAYGYSGNLDLKIGGHELTVSAYFINSVNNLLLLGRKDLFGFFNILFDNRNGQVVFEKI